MQKNRLMSVAALLALAATSACSQTPTTPATPQVAEKVRPMLNQTQPASYLAKVSGDGDAVIRSVFAQYNVVLVRALGNEQYELRLERDPGIDALNRIVEGSGGAVTAIQPNFVYKIN